MELVIAFILVLFLVCLVSATIRIYKAVIQLEKNSRTANQLLAELVKKVSE